MHDLRQPLQTLANVAAPLTRQIEAGQTSEALASARMIRSASNLLSQQLNGILEVSQLELGQIKACIANFALRDLFEDLRLRFGSACEAIDVSLHIDEPEATARVRVDSDFHLLFRALSNLISNSIKYRNFAADEPCFVRLSHRLTGGQLELVVEDNGIGIPSDELAGGRVFQPFYQANREHPGSKSGVGLGLSIVNAVVRLLPGHHLDMSSTVMQGTRVRLRLPGMTESASTIGLPPEVMPTDQMVALDGLRVLLVDDNVVLRTSMKTLLELAGAEVAAVGGVRAVGHWLDGQPRRPHVLVTDLRLQGESSGLDVMALVLQRVGQVPTLMLTGSSETDLDPGGVKVFRVIYKPVTPEQLTLHIAELAERTAAGGGSSSGPPESGRGP